MKIQPALAFLLAAGAVALTGCSTPDAAVTSCAPSGSPAHCGLEERFGIADATAVVADSRLSFDDDSTYSATVKLEQAPRKALAATLVIDGGPPIRPRGGGDCLAAAGTCTLTWDLADTPLDGARPMTWVPPTELHLAGDGDTVVVSIIEVQ